nr:hypothetical protein [uncultured Halomonas sp.]
MRNEQDKALKASIQKHHQASRTTSGTRWLQQKPSEEDEDAVDDVLAD